MSVKKTFLKEKVDRKIKRQYYLLKLLFILMSIILLYDVFIYEVPLYYLGFYVLGRLVGKIFRLTQHVVHTDSSKALVLKNHPFHIFLIVLVLVLRLVLGQIILEKLMVAYVTDAMYLFFIGLYYSRWKGMIFQIDELVYKDIQDFFKKTKRE